MIRLGVIGVNGRGRLWRFWHNPSEGVEVCAGADISPDELKKFKERCNPESFVTTDFCEMIARPELDGIIIATPDKFHAEQAIAALEAGKFVYCEKPMAIQLEDCDRMLAASRRNGNRLMIGFNMRYMPFVLKMKELIDSGEIGTLKAVWERHFVGMGSIYYYHDWHADKSNTTSLLLQKGSHDIDVVHFLAGSYTKRAVAFGGLDCFGGDRENTLECVNCPEKESCPDSNVSYIDYDGKPARRYCAYRKEVSVPDNYLCLFELENGVKFSYNECHFTPDYNRNFCFIGTKGRIENSEVEHWIKVWHRRPGRSDQPDLVLDVNELTNGDKELGHGGADPQICAAFIRMIKGEISAPVPPEAGRMSVAAGLAAQWSLENGNQVCEIPQIAEFCEKK